jgi:predicted CXXCH cytochrome family protein
MGFRPHPTHSEVPQICGGCHSDAAFIRQINGRLAVGQAALFNISLHGKLTAAGDPAAPDCSSCHGKHDVISPASPLSPVNRANVAKLCRGCHADRDRMARYQIPTDQFEKWEASVHGKAFAAGNPNAPTCTGCHGAHASAPPDAASVAHACGRCHEQEMQLFEQSPHSQGFRKRGLAQCVACHSNHDVTPATALMVGTGPDATCMKCHGHDEKPRKVADDIAGLLRGARARASEAREGVANARAEGLRVSGASYALDRVATAETKVRSVVHTLDPARVEAVVGEIDQAASEALSLVASAERDRRTERRGYYAALALAGLLLITLVLKARQLDRRRARGIP